MLSNSNGLLVTMLSLDTLTGVLALPTVLVGIFLLLLAGTYNRLATRRNEVDNAWAQIDLLLKHRHYLIPSLLYALNDCVAYEREIVEHVALTDCMAYEREVMENVTGAHSQALTAADNIQARADAENQLTQALRSLFASAEAHSELSSRCILRAYREELHATENKLVLARQRYNDSVLEYNTTRQTFPAALIALPLGFTACRLFAFEEEAEAERAEPVAQAR